MRRLVPFGSGRGGWRWYLKAKLPLRTRWSKAAPSGVQAERTSEPREGCYFGRRRTIGGRAKRSKRFGNAAAGVCPNTHYFRRKRNVGDCYRDFRTAFNPTCIVRWRVHCQAFCRRARQAVLRGTPNMEPKGQERCLCEHARHRRTSEDQLARIRKLHGRTNQGVCGEGGSGCKSDGGSEASEQVDAFKAYGRSNRYPIAVRCS